MIGDAEQHWSPSRRASIRISFDCATRGVQRLHRGIGLPYLIAFSTRLASAWLISSRLPCSRAVAALTRSVMPSSSASGS
jgi:hypothetical protein